MKLTKRGERVFYSMLGAGLAVLFTAGMLADGAWWLTAWNLGMIGGVVALIASMIIASYGGEER